MDINGFLKKISIYFVGTLSNNLINVILVPIYAYFVQSSDLGEYDYILSVANMLMPIAYASIWEAVLKYCINADKKNREKIFSTTIIYSLVVTVVVYGMLLLFYFIRKDTTEIFFIGIIITAQGITNIWQFSARALGENKTYVIAGILGSLTVILCDLFFISLGKLNYLGLSIAYISSQIVIILFIEQKIHLLFRVKIKTVSFTTLKKMLTFSVPLVINNVALWFYSGGNRVIVRSFIGASENGLYSFAAKFSILINLCSTVVSMAVIEEAYSYQTISEYKSKIGMLITYISKIYFSLIMLAVPAIYILYSVVFKNTEYYPSADYVFLLLLSALFTALSNNYGSSFQVTGNTKYIFITTVTGAIVSVTVSLLLVDSISIYGILFGGVIGPVIMMLARAVYAKKVTGLNVDWRGNILQLMLGVFISIVLRKYRFLSVQVVVFAIVFAFVIFFNKKEIKSILIKRR